jgi:LacI family transcriptional regulator
MPEPAVTLKDVARLARVHPATASRALNPETRLLVSEETARRVLAAAADLGYRPNTVAADDPRAS